MAVGIGTGVGTTVGSERDVASILGVSVGLAVDVGVCEGLAVADASGVRAGVTVGKIAVGVPPEQATNITNAVGKAWNLSRLINVEPSNTIVRYDLLTNNSSGHIIRRSARVEL